MEEFDDIALILVLGLIALAIYEASKAIGAIKMPTIPSFPDLSFLIPNWGLGSPSAPGYNGNGTPAQGSEGGGYGGGGGDAIQ